MIGRYNPLPSVVVVRPVAVNIPSIAQHFDQPVAGATWQRFDILRNTIAGMQPIGKLILFDLQPPHRLAIDMQYADENLDAVSRQTDNSLDIVLAVVTVARSGN